VQNGIVLDKCPVLKAFTARHRAKEQKQRVRKREKQAGKKASAA